MANSERVTVTLPAELVREIDRIERNRSKFVLTAVTHELERCRRAALRHSLDAPHAEAEELAELGFDEWALRLPEGEAAGLLDLSAGTAVRWVPGQGWLEPGS